MTRDQFLDRLRQLVDARIDWVRAEYAQAMNQPNESRDQDRLFAQGQTRGQMIADILADDLDELLLAAATDAAEDAAAEAGSGIETPRPHEVHHAYLICGHCGAKAHSYNPRVGRNREGRVCEHKDPTTGQRCPCSRQLLRDREVVRAD